MNIQSSPLRTVQNIECSKNLALRKVTLGRFANALRLSPQERTQFEAWCSKLKNHGSQLLARTLMALDNKEALNVQLF